jgi:hypothetical protein
MARPSIVPLALALVLPATALAEPPPDPNLHVDPSLKDCSVSFAPNLTQDAFRRFVREFGSVERHLCTPERLSPARLEQSLPEAPAAPRPE